MLEVVGLSEEVALLADAPAFLHMLESMGWCFAAA